MSRLQIQPAVKSASRLRLALFGPSGSGKTMTALRLAAGLGTRTGVIDTERGSAAKYSDRWPFDVIDLPTAAVSDYLEAINAFAAAGHDVLIIDSLSHAWEWLLDFVERTGQTKYKGNKWSAWSDATPLQNQLVNAILTYPGHTIVTMRSKTEWIIEDTGKGKSAPKRVGMAPKQRDGLEYEFDLLMELTTDNVARVIKDRLGRYQGQMYDKPDEALGAELRDWLAEGAPPATPVVTDTTASPAPVDASPAPRADRQPRPTPATLSAEKAAGLVTAVRDFGHPDPQAFAAATLDRPVAADLGDLNTNEAMRVHAAAKAAAEAAQPFEAPPSTEPDPFDHETGEPPATMKQLAAIHASLNAVGLDKQAIRAWLAWRLGRPIESAAEIRKHEAHKILDMTEDALVTSVDEYRTTATEPEATPA